MTRLNTKQEKMRVNRFVLDANIWVSYFITHREEFLIQLIVKSEIAIFSCNELIEELVRVLNYEHLKKYKVDVKLAVRTVQQLTTYFTITPPIKNYIPEDVNDNYVIALALQSNSGYVTSGDSHILEAKTRLEKRYSKLRIITKAEFEKMFA